MEQEIQECNTRVETTGIFVDSDDYLDSHALETLAKVTANDKYDMIYFNTYVVDEKGEKLQILQVQPPRKKRYNTGRKPGVDTDVSGSLE